MATVQIITVWKDLVPQLFKRSHFEWDRLWRLISSENYVFMMGDCYALLVPEPISLHVEACEGSGFKREMIETLFQIARLFNRFAVTCEVENDSKMARVLIRFGFIRMWVRGRRARMMRVLNG